MEGLFEDEVLAMAKVPSPRQDPTRVVTSPRVELPRIDKWDFPLGSSTRETSKSGTTGKAVSQELMEAKIEVFRLGLDLTILALRDERNRRWFEVSTKRSSRAVIG